MKKKIYKIVAVYLALNLLVEIASPTVAFALTNGPSQPEMESFEPVGTTEMVDPFSGDFNYNIPLMTVPGPNGGYPINLAYHAGIGMEQEASWVGLGWNINAGEISRQMRGLPDDFNGDLVTQTRYMRPNITASLTGKTSVETVGMDASMGFGVSASLGLSWNSYQGIGISMGQGANAELLCKSNAFTAAANTNYNSFTGTTDLSASLSYTGGQNGRARTFGLGFSRNSVEGIKSLDINPGFTTFGLTSFSGSSFIPHAEMPLNGFSVMASFDAGADIVGLNPYVGVETSFSLNQIAKNSIDFKAYGYLNSQSRNADDESQNYSLMDFNREKDVPLTKDIPALPMAQFTHDLYFVKGQGVGGAFRPYRSDIGVLKDPAISSKNYGANLGLEIGAPTIKVGNDVTVSYSKAYSGPWRDANMWAGIKSAATFEGKSTDYPLYEPFYFKNTGELTADYTEETRMVSPEEAFPIKMAFGISASDFVSPTIAAIEQPLIDVKADNLNAAAATNLVYSKLQNRQSRSQLMALRTRGQMSNASSSSMFGDNIIFNTGVYPRTGSPTGYDYTTGHPAEHTGEITVINPDGNRYIYGIPVYNTSTKEVSFSVNHENTTDNRVYENNRLIDYSTDDASENNEKNDDHFYNSKTLPAYAHSYLLTAIVSPDYVDMTGNGLTEDDYGYYTKFNYSKLKQTVDDEEVDASYKWRSPFRKASFMDGFHSISNDDKAGYVYGEKEIWYLNSIETKTHVAEFHLSPRADAYGAANEKNASGLGQALMKLDKIDLYSKNDASYTTDNPVPIKTAHFDYTYDLCGSVKNNDGSEIGGTNYYEDYDRNANHGKLTLKKVWLTSLGNDKGSLSPYEFDYHERNRDVSGAYTSINLVENPNYSTMKMDRWGNYKEDLRYDQTYDHDGYNDEDPYTIQRTDFNYNGTEEADNDADLRNAQASAWCLKAISLPSGGKILIDYESDDYAYVQDQAAMQVARIKGVGSSPEVCVGADGNTSITDDELFVAFELEDQSATTDAAIWPYVKNIKDLYFKTYQKLKKYYVGSESAFDYVTGYAKVAGSNPDGTFSASSDEGSNYGIVTDGDGVHYGFLKLATVNVHDSKYLAGLDHTNPFRKAGWQYLKLSRPDLLSPSSTNNLSTNPTTATLLQMTTSAISYFTSNFQLLSGYYNYCMVAGFSKELQLSFDTSDGKIEHPSFIRVNSPDLVKYGGGHRVKRIIQTDSWSGSATTNNYGQEYSYRLTDDETSSGVASYEPLVGGEEIPLHQPIRYNSEYFIVQRHDLYMEYPFCESYYPAARVGYSRVVVKGINHKDATTAYVTKGTQGISLYEFYTAKDFPVTVKNSDLPDFHKKFKHSISIPFIGDISFDNHGFSQSFTVETNDMNGKLKGVSTYPYGTTDLTEPNAVSKTSYIYKTDVPYTASGTNHLNNSVDVLFDEAYHKTATIGLTKEHFIDMRERSSISMINGGQINSEYTYPAILMFSFVPRAEYSENLDKTIVSMHVINRNGILTETQQLNEGSLVKTNNLMFDAATGDPLLTTVTNDFDQPVYSYDFAAHWAYDGMGAAYKNNDATFDVPVSSGVCSLSVGYPENYLLEGDEVSVNTDATHKYWVTNINPGASGTFLLTRDDGSTTYSGSSCIMTIMRSKRRNLQDVSSGNIVSLSNPVSARVFPLFDAWNAHYDLYPYTPPNGFSVTDCATGTTVEVTVDITSSTKITFTLHPECSARRPYLILPNTSDNFHLQKSGNRVYAVKFDGTRMQGTLVDPDGCFRECAPDVLHASATTFKDDWTTEIDQVQQDVYNNQLAAPTPFLSTYASGQQGIWKTTTNNVYQVDRKRNAAYTSPTDISKDGTYNNFVLYNWTDAVLNPLWTTTATITKINPYGFEIENKDALNIYSSALYGYNNSLQTAVTTNAPYYETAFDGFEDYGSGGYITGHGHLQLALDGEDAVGGITSNAHTGKKGITVEDGALKFESAPYYFTPVSGNKYLVSAWFKAGTGTPAITFTGATAGTTTLGPPIEGWRKYDVAFTASSTSISITFDVTGGSGIFSLDDVRIQPFRSVMKTYVYDPEKLWLKAELDNQNFATFYNYDKEGTMYQVKKETVKGISTIKTTNSNVKQRLP